MSPGATSTTLMQWGWVVGVGLRYCREGLGFIVGGWSLNVPLLALLTCRVRSPMSDPWPAAVCPHEEGGPLEGGSSCMHECVSGHASR